MTPDLQKNYYSDLKFQVVLYNISGNLWKDEKSPPIEKLWRDTEKWAPTEKKLIIPGAHFFPIF